MADQDQQRARGRIEWSKQRRREYIEFCTGVVQNSRGPSPFLEADAAREIALLSVAG